MSTPGSSTADRLCTPCGSGRFSANSNAPTCTAWTVCQAGTLVSSPGSSTADRTCAPCPPGSFASSSNQPTCTPWGVCAPGSFTQLEGTPASDRLCAPCPAETFTSSPNAAACAPWSVCNPGTFVQTNPSATADRACTPCASRTFSSTPNATSCTPWTDCSPGTFVQGPGSTSGDQVCGTCPASTFTDARNAPSCTPWRVCTGGVEVAAGTAFSNRACLVLRQFGTTLNDQARSVAIDTGGNVLVAGFLGVNGGDAFVRKYDPSGVLLWDRPFGSTGYDIAFALAVGPGDVVHVAGRVTGALPGHTALGSADAFVRTYAANGTELRTIQFGTPASETAYGLAVDAAGRIAVTGGITAGAFPGFVNTIGDDVFVRVYDASGLELWTRQISSSFVSNEVGHGAAFDAAGNLFIGGVTERLATAAGGRDAFIMKFDGSGTRLWLVQSGGPDDDEGLGVAVTPAGDAYLTGVTDRGATRSDAFLTKYASSGGASWRNTFRAAAFTQAQAVATDATGRVVMVGGSGFDLFARVYDEAGTLQFQSSYRHQLGAWATGTATDPLGRIVLCGSVDVSGGTLDAFVGWISR